MAETTADVAAADKNPAAKKAPGFFVNAGLSFVRQGAAALLQLALLVLIGRIYGTEGAGTYAVAILVPTLLVAFLSLGVGPANIYYLASGRVAPRLAWKVTLQLAAGITVLGLTGGAAFIMLFADRWLSSVPTTLLWTALASFPLLLLLGFTASMFQGLGRFRQFNAVLVFHPLVNLLVVAGLVLSGNRDLGLLLVGYLAGAAVAFVFARFLLGTLLVDGEGLGTREYRKSVLNYGYKAQLSNVLALVNYKADIMLVSMFSGGAAAGVYVVAVQLAEKLWLYSQAVSTVLLPRLSKFHRGEKEGVEITPLVTRWVIWGTALLAAALALVGNYLILWAFGDEFSHAYQPLLILLPGVILGAGSRILANDMAARGRPELGLYTATMVVIVNVLGNLYAIPRFGLLGAATATTVAYSFNFVVRSLIYHRLSGTQAIRLFVPQIGDWHSLRQSLMPRGAR